jgi:hypothetical protein
MQECLEQFVFMNDWTFSRLVYIKVKIHSMEAI